MLDVGVDRQRRHFVWVFDLARWTSGHSRALPGDGQVILVRHGATTVGLLVDDVHSVQCFAPEAASPIGMAGDEAGVTVGLIKANGGELLIQEISVEKILARVCAAMVPA